MTTKFRQLLEQVDIELSQPITDDAVSFIVNEEIELEVPVVEHSDGSITLAPDDFVYNFLSEEYTFEDEQDMAEARHISAGADNISSAKKLWQYVRRNLTDLASNAEFDEDLNKLYIEDKLSNLFKTEDGQQVKIAFTTSGGIKFDQGILYIPIGVMWYYRGLYTSESFINDVINALNGKKGVEEAKNPEDFMNQLKGLGRRLPSQSTLDKVFNEYDYDRVGDNLWKALDRGDEKNTLRFINSYLDQGSAQAWWGDLQAIGVEIDLDDPEQSIFTWNKTLPTDDQQGVAEGSNAKQFVAARFIDEFGDGDHWYVKGTPELIQKFIMLANSIEQASMAGSEYDSKTGSMGQIHSQLGNADAPQWTQVPANNLNDIKPINSKVINKLTQASLKNPGDEWMSDFLWTLEGLNMAVVGDDLSGQSLNEAKYQGREVNLGKPMAGDVKKYKVYVKDPQTGNVKKVNFGDKKLSIKRDNPGRRKNFRARHRCATAKDRTSARYWSCRMWSKKPVSKILRGK